MELKEITREEAIAFRDLGVKVWYVCSGRGDTTRKVPSPLEAEFQWKIAMKIYRDYNDLFYVEVE